MTVLKISRAMATAFGAASVATLAAGGPSLQKSRNEPAQEMLRRSVPVNETDWRAEPGYDHCERDYDGDVARTYDVTMVEGSRYERLVAVDDRPLSASHARAELRKLDEAVTDRRRESSAARRDRLSAYRATRARIRALFDELARAFTFSNQGLHNLDGVEAYVLNGTPRPGYEPPNRDAQALTGMKAVFWIGATTYQWIKIRAFVTTPVSIVGFHLVRAEPGTTIEMEKAPVGTGIWLTKHLRIESASRILFLVPHHTFYDERDFNYRPSSHILSTCVP